MEKDRKYRIVLFTAIVFCLCGCLLLIVPIFNEVFGDLLAFALAFNGIGIAAFLYSQKLKNEKQV